VNPVYGIITSLFGHRINPVLGIPEFHDGIDIAVSEGTGVIAVKDGIVIEVRYSNSFGNLVRYRTSDGYEIMYAHLKTIHVEVGDEIELGQIIAYSGNTGLSTAPHLHYTIWRNGVLIDPIYFVDLPYTEIVAEEFRQRKALLN